MVLEKPVNTTGVSSPYNQPYREDIAPARHAFAGATQTFENTVGTSKFISIETDQDQAKATEQDTDTYALITPDIAGETLSNTLRKVERKLWADPMGAADLLLEINPAKLPLSSLDRYAGLTEHLADQFVRMPGEEASNIYWGLSQRSQDVDRIIDAVNKISFDFEVFSGPLSFADLGLDIEFFNTGINSPGSVPEPDVKVNRQQIEAHFDDERFKPKMFVQPFSGTSYG